MMVPHMALAAVQDLQIARGKVSRAISLKPRINVHLYTTVYINITQYSSWLGTIVEVQIPFILLTSSQMAIVYIG